MEAVFGHHTVEARRARIRDVSPPIAADRPFYRDIAAVDALIAAGAMRP